MTSENLLSTPLITPVYNSRPELPPPALASWNDVLGAYKNAWDALDEVDDHHTAFLAIQVAHDAVQAYGSNLTTRPPKMGTWPIYCICVNIWINRTRSTILSPMKPM